MTATRQQLKKRWEQEPGRSILSRLSGCLAEMGTPGHRGPKDIFLLLEGLPFREEVATGRDLRGIYLAGGVRMLDLAGCDFSFAKLDFNLIDCDLRGARFDEASINGIITRNLVGARFWKAKLRGCSFDGADARKCCFDGATLIGASFQNANIEGSSFLKANCKGGVFVGANLVNCNFQGANLDEAAFQKVNLDKTTDLRGASLMNLFHQEHRDHSGRLVNPGTNWRLAMYDATTRYGEDPAAEALEVLEALVGMLSAAQGKQERQLKELASRLEVELRRQYRHTWYEELLMQLPVEDRAWAEEQIAAAMRSLV